MALSFWASVRTGELRPRDAVPNSPMHALLRLYGALGPALVVGLEDIWGVTGVSASPVAEGPRGVCSAEGDLQRSGEDDTSFVLFWRPGSRSNLVEVEGFPLEHVGAFLARKDEFGKAWRRRFDQFLVPAPEPIVELNPTAQLLLDQAAPFAGLGYASRCLAAWWQLAEEGDSDPGPLNQLDRSLAASIESLVAKRLDMRVTAPSLAERYGCSVDHVRRHAKRLQADVRKAGEPWW